jgi:maltose O-acetyltransferase
MASEKEKMRDGKLYNAGDPKLVADREQAREITRKFNQTAATEYRQRRNLLKELLGSLGDECEIEPPFRCDYGTNIHVDENFYANFECVILDVCRVEIGENCLIGPSVHIYTATHPLPASERVKGPEYGKPVTIGDDVWIGGRAILNPGVTVGNNAVLGSGAVVTDNVPDNAIVQGNPATVVKRIE